MATKKQNSTETDTPQNAYFLSLELENVRCFGERQKIDFSDGNGKWKRWTIILGDNGTGKTTLLQSLVSLSPFNEQNGFGSGPLLVPINGNNILYQWKPFRNLKNNETRILARYCFEGENINVIDENPEFSASGTSNWAILGGTFENIIVNCVAYGASRKSGETSISEQKNESHYITLFDETALLLNPEEWLIRANYARFSQTEISLKLPISIISDNLEGDFYQEKRNKLLTIVIELLKKVLPDVDDIRFNERELPNKNIPQPVVEFHTPYGWVEAKDLSLGYRTSMAWMVDFASRMFDLYPESKNPLAEPAVVLIDEIDLHLHPKWQRDLLDWLSDLCPNTQFIVTTHSPLIVQAGIAKDANIVVCRREGDHVVIDQSIEAVKGWRADQILTSDLFDIPKRDKNTEEALERRKELLSKSKLTKAEKTELAKLNESVDALPVSENLEDDKAMKIIRKAAKFIQENGAAVK